MGAESARAAGEGLFKKKKGMKAQIEDVAITRKDLLLKPQSDYHLRW